MLPIYQIPECWLRKCIESVVDQVYQRWQLCIVDDVSPDGQVMAILCEYAARYHRIEVAWRDQNSHISEASNSALAMARGSFVALLDHDEKPWPHALLEMAKAIVPQPRLELLYSHGDRIDVTCHGFDPYFKPDFDPDPLRSQNYVCHFIVVRADLMRNVGGFRQGFEGSEDHDLILHCTIAPLHRTVAADTGEASA